MVEVIDVECGICHSCKNRIEFQKSLGNDIPEKAFSLKIQKEIVDKK